MDPPRFAHHYSELIQGLRRCGMPTPWLDKPSRFLRFLYLGYDTFSILLICFTAFIYIYPIATKSRSFQDMSVLIHGLFLFWGVLAVSCYQLLYRHRLKQLTDSLDRVARDIVESQLGQEEAFLQLYSKDSKYIGSLSKTMPTFQVCCAWLYCTSVPLMEWCSGAYRSHQPLPVGAPFGEKQPGVYEILFLVVVGTLSVCCSKKGLNDCLFLSLFKILTGYLQYLSMSMKKLQMEFIAGDNKLIKRKIIRWIKLHQEIDRNIRMLLGVFSPVVIIYYVYMIGFLVTAAFVQMKKENDNIFQSAGAGGSGGVIFMQMYMMSNSAGKLTAEAKKLSQVTYDTPWYLMNTNNRNMIRMIMVMANKPIQVTAYRAQAFLLNRETFANVILSAVSGFVTLCQLKDRYD